MQRVSAGDLDLAMCNFAEDAVVIHDTGIDRGVEAIRESLAFLQAHGVLIPPAP